MLLEHLDVIFFQETLGLGEDIFRVFENLFLCWFFLVVDVKGLSGGLALRLNQKSTKIINSWGCEGVIIANIFSEENGCEICLINVYGPYQDMAPFWNKLLNCDFMKPDKLVLGGDLNFSLGLL